MLKEDIKNILNNKAPFNMEIKGSDLTSFMIEQIVEIFFYVAEVLDLDYDSQYTEVYKCGCYYDLKYYPIRETIEKTMNRLLKEKEAIEKIALHISYREDLGLSSIYVTRKEMCEKCLEMPRRIAGLKEAKRPDSLFQNAVYSHGLATGFGAAEVTAEKAEENLMTLLGLSWEDTEICCSWKTQQIGGFGFFVRGEVTIASNRDLWSYVGRSGQREFNPDENEKYLISRRDELDLSVWDHTEFFVKPKEVIAFWAKDWFVRDVPGGRELVEKFRQRGYKVYITRRRHH